MIQFLDRQATAEEISRCAQEHGLCMPVLFEVNIGGKAARHRRISSLLPEPELSIKASGFPD